ncbi:hypothetical protein FO519_003292 [Halicephalobus sp. NKZ332]|nr:hypothetical protein FO519_003292 [Halicephalobus sp. NKZ332]
MVLCISLLANDQPPLYFKCIPGDVNREDDLRLFVYSSLDVFDEKMQAIGNKPHQELFLGSLYLNNKFRSYGYMTNTQVKILVVVDATNQSIKEHDMRVMSVKPVNRVVKITNVSDFVTPSQQCVLKTPASPATPAPAQQGVEGQPDCFVGISTLGETWCDCCPSADPWAAKRSFVMKQIFLLLLVVVTIINFSFAAPERWSFLYDQSACRVRCLNNGVCLYKIGRPNVHSCRCYEGLYYGDRCQYSGTSPPTTKKIRITTTTRDPYAEQESMDDQFLSEEQRPQKIVTLESAEKQTEEKQDYFGHNEASSNEVEVATNLETPNGHYFEPDTPGDQFRQSSKTTHSIERDSGEEVEDGWAMKKMLQQLSLGLIAAVIAIASGDIQGDLQDGVNKATNIEGGSKWCPVLFAGTECPPSGFAWHYKCCGELNNQCCFHLQNWAIIILVILAIFVVVSLALGLIRCLFCRRT